MARTLRIDYKTLVAAIGVVAMVILMVAFLDASDARHEAARAAQAKDEQIARRDKALGDAAAEAAKNGQEIADLIKQIDALTATVASQDSVVSALRNELAKRGISTIVENGKVRVVPGPVSTSSGGVGARGSASSPTSSRGVGAGAPTTRFTGPPRPTGTTTRPTTRPPTVTVTRTGPTVTVAPSLPLPVPLPTATIPLPTICLPPLICVGKIEGTP